MSEPLFRVETNPWRDPADQGPLIPFGAEAARRVRSFHAGIEGYAATPLHDLVGLAGELGVGRIWLKDEGLRFGLKAFKGLGASYAMARELGEGAGPVTFVTATDGNHGRAVAWAAARMGQASLVFLPAAASSGREAAIAALGARTARVDGDYEAACQHAAAAAEAPGHVLLQDVAWPGYEVIPRHIMQGYLTLVDEAIEQMGGATPTHVFLQCGVGSFAGAVAAHLVTRLEARPRIVLVEPADSASALAAFESGGDAPPVAATTGHTFMACLACAQLSTLGWRILRSHADDLIVLHDGVARRGMRELASPRGGDPPIVSGESGAATAGALIEVCETGGDTSRKLDLDARARVLLISTEADTDPEVYRATVGAS